MRPRLLLVAAQLLTRVPVGEPWREPRDLPASVGWFGVVGALLGGVAASTWWAAGLVLAPPAAATLAVGVLVVLTGALHEDGLADTADGLVGGAGPARRLEIMRDSRLGTYGVLALVLALLLRVTLLASMPPVAGAAAVLVAVTSARGGLGLALLRGRPAAEGSGAGVLGGLRTGPAVVSGLTALGVAALLAQGRGLVMAGAALVAAAGVRALAVRRLGGLTGDVMGAMVVSSELVALLVAAAMPR